MSFWDKFKFFKKQKSRSNINRDSQKSFIDLINSEEDQSMSPHPQQSMSFTQSEQNSPRRRMSLQELQMEEGKEDRMNLT